MLNTNYRFGEVHRLSTQVEPTDQRVEFKNVFENAGGGV